MKENEGYHIIISIDAEKAFDKNPTSFPPQQIKNRKAF